MEQYAIAFICVENSCRSQMAEAFAKMYCNDHDLEHIAVYSAGSQASGQVNPKAVTAMAEIDYDLSSHESKKLEQLPDKLTHIVTMGCGDSCPFIPARHRLDWQITDPKDMDAEAFNEVRDQIAQKVEDLLAHLG